MAKSKLDEYEVRDLYDGRHGLFKNGLCILVAWDPDEIKEYFRLRQRGPDRYDQNRALSRALR